MADCALPLDCSEVYGELTIDGWSLHTGAWCAFDLSSLWSSPAFRGDNVLVETLAGRQARPVLDDETEYSVPMMFSGAVDRVGAPYGDAAAGLFANRRAFVGRMVDPIRAGISSLAASLVVEEGSGPETYTAQVQPTRLEWTLLPNGYARAVLTIRVPLGRFAV